MKTLYNRSFAFNQVLGKMVQIVTAMETNNEIIKLTLQLTLINDKNLNLFKGAKGSLQLGEKSDIFTIAKFHGTKQ